MFAEWLAWGQAHSAILSVIGSSIIAIGTIAAALITANRYLKIYQTHVSMEFFRRYAEISQRMPDRLRLSKIKNPSVAASHEVSPEEWPAIARSMIEYGNLCSEEFALHKEGRIPREIWKIWREGIKENFETAIWRNAWRLVSIEYQSYRSFFAFMEAVIKEAEASEAKSTPNDKRATP